MLKTDSLLKLEPVMEVIKKHNLVVRNESSLDISFGSVNTVIYGVNAKIKRFKKGSCVFSLRTKLKVMCNRDLNLSQAIELTRELQKANSFIRDIEKLELEFLCVK